jgi:hypothetical protein
MSKYAQGKFTVKNPEKYLGNKEPTYRSGWEWRFMEFCDSNPSVIRWASEPLRIPYFNPVTNKKTNYVPDFLIEYIDKDQRTHVEMVEIKPSKERILERAKSQRDKLMWVINQAKWGAAQAFCQQRGIIFRVISEDNIFHNGRAK